jgi:hypothetical protein
MINPGKEINHSDPKVFGPVLWDEFAEDAAECTTEVEQRFFCKRMRRRARTLKCKKCQEDFTKMIELDPPEHYIWSRTTHGNEYAMLFWIWKQHNIVNVKLGKPQYDWEACFQRFTNVENMPAPCTDCGSGTAISTSSYLPTASQSVSGSANLSRPFSSRNGFRVISRG